MTASTPTSDSLPVTERSALRHKKERGSHERAAIYAILDEALICHVAAVVDGAPRVLPTAHVRVGDSLYLHGGRANRMIEVLAAGEPACLTVTLVDGLVFARSALRHSMNYRSVVLHGSASEVNEPAEKLQALAALIDHMAPGRSAEARLPNEAELYVTRVVKWSIAEASAKARSGPPVDLESDLQLPCWAGVLPVQSYARAPEPDAHVAPGAVPSRAVAKRAALYSPAALFPYERAQGDMHVTTDPARIDFGFVHRFLARESYWARDVDAELQRRSMQHTLCFGLFRGERPIGFARVLTDYGRLAYLGDVFVIASERGRGAGQWLIEQVLAHPALAGVDRWLLGTADAHALYARFGFVAANDNRYMVRRASR